jgi:DNA-binding winged helix-turn-helix (wHTH) protein/tetratricopeptide (TPR) repeat protein/TolB-like protein
MTITRDAGISTPPADTGLLRFGRFELDPLRQELRRSGHLVRLPRQPLRILVLLTARAGEVVTRQEIQQEIWGEDTFVDFEQGINAAIRQIRFALGDNAEAARYVETLPRVGYCFIAPVELTANEPPALIAVADWPSEPMASAVPPPAIRRPFALAILVAVLLAIAGGGWMAMRWRQRPAQPRGLVIAVLPFRVIGAAPEGIDDRSFTADFRAILGRVLGSRIRVLDGRAVGAGNESAAALARRTGATLVIEGTIQRVPAGVRVIVSAVDPSTEMQSWTETYERTVGRAPNMPVEVSHFVTHSIAQRYFPPPRREARLLTRLSPPALELYRQARVELNRVAMHRDAARARRLFEAVLREEPRLSEAWSGLAGLSVEDAFDGPPAGRAEAAARSKEYARRALAIQPLNAEAHSELGLLAFQRDYDYGRAEDELRAAVAADPEYAEGHVNLAMVLIAIGQPEEALTHWSLGQQLDPELLDLHPLQSLLYLHSRRYEDALACYREMLALWPDRPGPVWGTISVLVLQNRWREAIGAVRRATQQTPLPEDVPVSREVFQREYVRFEPFLQNAVRRGVLNGYAMAVYYAERGDSERAFAGLRLAIDQKIPSISWMLVDPRLDGLRADSRFEALTHYGRLMR